MKMNPLLILFGFLVLAFVVFVLVYQFAKLGVLCDATKATGGACTKAKCNPLWTKNCHFTTGLCEKQKECKTS
jgi:hypothetical protein